MTVFTRYGVAKTTMSDIATEAGVARQTVYNAFPGKPELLRATTELAIRDYQSEVRAAWAGTDDLAERLDIFFALGPLKWHEMSAASPQVAELLDGIGEHASVEVAQATHSWTGMFVEMFKATGLASTDPEVSLADIADFLYSSSMDAKHSTPSLERLRGRLRTIKAAVLSLLERSA